MFFDGAAQGSRSQSGLEALYLYQRKNPYPGLGMVSNNYSDISMLWLLLRLAKKIGIKRWEVFGGSQVSLLTG